MYKLRHRLTALRHGDWTCFLHGHDWDIAAHGPGGSTFTCVHCPATHDTKDGFRR